MSIGGDRVETIARALCRAAGLDPDQMVEPDVQARLQPSRKPDPGLVPAWRRFELTAENFCAISHDLIEPRTRPFHS